MQIIPPAEICAMCAVRGIELLSVELLLMQFASPGVKDIVPHDFPRLCIASPVFYTSSFPQVLPRAC